MGGINVERPSTIILLPWKLITKLFPRYWKRLFIYSLRSHVSAGGSRTKSLYASCVILPLPHISDKCFSGSSSSRIFIQIKQCGSRYIWTFWIRGCIPSHLQSSNIKISKRTVQTKQTNKLLTTSAGYFLKKIQTNKQAKDSRPSTRVCTPHLNRDYVLTDWLTWMKKDEHNLNLSRVVIWNRKQVSNSSKWPIRAINRIIGRQSNITPIRRYQNGQLQWLLNYSRHCCGIAYLDLKQSLHPFNHHPPLTIHQPAQNSPRKDINR